MRHRVTAERATWRYFRRRCWAEGLSKALVRKSVGADAALASERGYVLRTLPTGIWNGIRVSIRGDWCGLATGRDHRGGPYDHDKRLRLGMCA